jgi:hypothetical protein
MAPCVARVSIEKVYYPPAPCESCSALDRSGCTTSVASTCTLALSTLPLSLCVRTSVDSLASSTSLSGKPRALIELPWACTHFPSHSDHPLCGRSKTCCCWWPPCERAARVPASRTGSCLVAVGAQTCREMMMYNRRRALAATPTVSCGVHDSRAGNERCARCSHLYTIEQQAHTPTGAYTYL